MQDGGLTHWLSGLSIFAIASGTFALMLVASVVGQLVRQLQASRAGQISHESEQSVAQEGYLLGGILGLLGLLLAFSFGMVLNRFEARRELVTQEANAIGTAYLRAQLLDEPHRARLSNLLTAYTENRIKLASVDLAGNPYVPTNDRLLTEIWAAVRASRESAFSHGITTALLMTFNEVIDLDAERKIAWQLRVPSEVLILLIVYLSVTAAVVGHATDGPRGRRAAFALFLLIALSIGAITDVNRPMSSRSRESQLPMLMLLRSLQSQPPHVFDQFDVPSETNRRQVSQQ
jgi:hypothetical protein